MPILELVIEMAEYAPYPILETAFTELRRTPLPEITETFLNFLCLYTLNVLKNIQRRRGEAKTIIKQLDKLNEGKEGKVSVPSNELFDDKYRLHDVDMIWKLMTYADAIPKVEGKVKEQAIICLVKIVENSDHFGRAYVAKAVKAVKENLPGAVRCIRFLTTVYRVLSSKRELCLTIRTAISKESGLLEAVIKGLAIYKQKVNVAVGSGSKNIMTTVSPPRYNKR